MRNIAAEVGGIVPELYASRAWQSGRPPTSDMSRSNLCHELTLDLWDALHNRGISARREMHEYGGLWHFVIAHSDQPAPDELITDLNPWRGIPNIRGVHTGYLHGERSEIQQMLLEAGAPEEWVALRGVQTIVEPHTLQHRYGPELRQTG